MRLSCLRLKFIWFWLTGFESHPSQSDVGTACSVNTAIYSEATKSMAGTCLIERSTVFNTLAPTVAPIKKKAPNALSTHAVLKRLQQQPPPALQPGLIRHPTPPRTTAPPRPIPSYTALHFATTPHGRNAMLHHAAPSACHTTPRHHIPDNILDTPRHATPSSHPLSSPLTRSRPTPRPSHLHAPAESHTRSYRPDIRRSVWAADRVHSKVARK